MINDDSKRGTACVRIQVVSTEIAKSNVGRDCHERVLEVDSNINDSKSTMIAYD
jgi:hypothetical protein